MNWKVQWNALKNTRPWDRGDAAWRPLHTTLDRTLAIPFVRRIDCERAVAFLNEKMPLNNHSVEEAIEEMNRQYGSREMLCRFLVANFCAW